MFRNIGGFLLNNILHIVPPIKIIFTVFALFAWSRAILRFREKSMNAKELVFWSLLWLSMIIAVYIPGKAFILARLLGLDNGLDALFFISVVVLFYSVYRLYVKSNENEQVITDLVRQLALKNGLSKKKKRS